MNEHQQFLQNLYDAFNKREIETIISLMRSDVKWANGLEGGFVYGRDAVRDYWTNQFKAIQPELETLKFETDENNRNNCYGSSNHQRFAGQCAGGYDGLSNLYY